VRYEPSRSSLGLSALALEGLVAHCNLGRNVGDLELVVVNSSVVVLLYGSLGVALGGEGDEGGASRAVVLTVHNLSLCNLTDRTEELLQNKRKQTSPTDITQKERRGRGVVLVIPFKRHSSNFCVCEFVEWEVMGRLGVI
jgi:hypothetical protein